MMPNARHIGEYTRRIVDLRLLWWQSCSEKLCPLKEDLALDGIEYHQYDTSVLDLAPHVRKFLIEVAKSNQ